MIEIDTHKLVEVIDITPSVEGALQKSKIEDGICLVYTLHTTTGLAINESDPDLVQDVLKFLA
jgi:secondary thiamine-phosphate synthase enzyme